MHACLYTISYDTHHHTVREEVEHKRLDDKCLSKVDRVGQLQWNKEALEDRQWCHVGEPNPLLLGECHTLPHPSGDGVRDSRWQFAMPVSPGRGSGWQITLYVCLRICTSCTPAYIKCTPHPVSITSKSQLSGKSLLTSPSSSSVLLRSSESSTISTCKSLAALRAKYATA